MRLHMRNMQIQIYCHIKNEPMAHRIVSSYARRRVDICLSVVGGALLPLIIKFSWASSALM